MAPGYLRGSSVLWLGVNIPSMIKRLIPTLAATFILGLTACSAEETVSGRPDILDGGTLQFDTAVLRLHGIVARSARQKCRRGSLPWLCGAASRTFLEETIAGRVVTCTVVMKGVGKCEVGGLDLSLRVIAEGWAVPANDGESYREAEASARAAGLGLWKK